MKGTSYVLSFRMVFFYLVTTGWIFDISLCEDSINQSCTPASVEDVSSILVKQEFYSGVLSGKR